MTRASRGLLRAAALRRGGGREPISWRVRGYLAVLSFRHLGFGIGLLEGNRQIGGSAAFRYIFDVAGVEWWAAAFLVTGFFALGGIVWPRALPIRILLVASVGISLSFAGGTFLALLNQPPVASSIVPVAFAVFALKDLLVSGMSFENPIEAMVYREEHLEGRSSP